MCSVQWSFDWFVDCGRAELVKYCFDWSIDWLLAGPLYCSDVPSIDWLIDWSADGLIPYSLSVDIHHPVFLSFLLQTSEGGLIFFNIDTKSADTECYVLEDAKSVELDLQICHFLNQSAFWTVFLTNPSLPTEISSASPMNSSSRRPSPIYPWPRQRAFSWPVESLGSYRLFNLKV